MRDICSGWGIKNLPIMKKIYLNTFASLVGIKKEGSLIKAMIRMVESSDVPFRYSRIRPSVRSFFIEGCDSSVLSDKLAELETVVVSSDFKKNDLANSKLALKMILETSFRSLEGKKMCRPEIKSYTFYGIQMAVNPDAIIKWKGEDGKVHVGAIKTKLKKSSFRKDEAVMIACILKHYLYTLYPDCVVEESCCFCFDAFRRRMYSPENYLQNIVRAAGIARKLSLMDREVA